MKESKPEKGSKYQEPANENSFPITAIGASAGGLEAMMELLKHLPPDTGMAFIYVQHLGRDTESKLTEILSKKTKMNVREIHDMDEIRPNNLFIIPSGKGIEVTDGHIKLIPRSSSSKAVTIDVLFSSLAHAHKERVIGVILSGSANDGTIGAEAVKNEGGLTFAQDDSATFGSMPKSAIAKGAIDFVLPPKEIAHELKRLSGHPFVNGNAGTIDDKRLKNLEIQRDHPELRAIFNRLQELTNVDFSCYKLKTIIRRMHRRMLLHQISSLKAYAKLLDEDSSEVNILYQDLLINVTRFFRETEAHAFLKETLFPKLISEKSNGDPLRIWVPACATGEEAYSIAMILLELLKRNETDIPVQIFATDLSKKAIEKARIGAYEKNELQDVSPERLQRFFTKSDGSYRINKSVRSMCVFAPHNILRDPPFSHLDLISCCNIFIYLDTAAQKKAVGVFHYALKQSGYLMIGKSESISHSEHLFGHIDKNRKVYSPKKKSEVRGLPELAHHFPRLQLPKEKESPNGSQTVPGNKLNVEQKGLEKAIDTLLISEYLPASVVINHHMEILQFRGDTDLYLTHPKGKATFNVLKMARPEIAFELRTAISQVIKKDRRFRKSGIEVNVNSSIKSVAIEVVPLKIEGDEPLLLVLFTEQDQVEVQVPKGGKKSGSTSKDLRINKLEEELAVAKADALASSQDQEAYTEELQSAHEEVVSTNEELQTVNEELETSKEELESANEELIVSVQELQTRNDLLNESYQYTEAIINTMHDPLLILGNDLRVKSANRAFYKNFDSTDEQTEGKLLYDLGNKEWDIPALRELLEDIIPNNSSVDNFEVKHTFLNLGEKIMLLNANRIVQKTHREQLILLMISDVTETRHLLLEKELREKELLTKELDRSEKDKLRLEKAVNERTAELKKANKALQQKNADLLTLNTELEAFSYVASHDLQEPLRMITSYMELLLRKYGDRLDDKALKYIDFATDGAKKMKSLTRDLLDYSKAGKETGQVEAVDVKKIIDEYRKLRRKVISEKNATIEWGDLPTLHTHEMVMTQVLHNLLDNSLKYSKEGVPPKVRIDARETEKEWEFSVSDNGIGIEPDNFEKIFIMFQRLHDRRQYEGTGIGLSTAKRQVEFLGGEIRVDSAPGEGSTFYFTVPKQMPKK